MPLETATYTSDLVTSNPAHTDGLNAADAHLRLIKSTIKNTLPNFTSAALASTQAQIDAAVAASTGTAVSQFPLGTALLPGHTPIGDPDTGIYSPGANQVSIAVGGLQALAVNADKSVSMAGALGTVGGIVSAGTIGAAAFTGGSGQLIPTGTPLPWLTDTAPTGFLMANGQAVSRTTFSALFTVFSTFFGVGDGSTTFNLPNMQEVVLVGKSTMGGAASPGRITSLVINTVGAVVGEEKHALTTPELASHAHPVFIRDPQHSHPITNNFLTNGGTGSLNGGAGVAWGSQTTTTAASTGVHTNSVNGGGAGTDDATATSGSGTAHNNVQPSMVVNYIIKT